MPADSGRYPSGQRGQTVNLLALAFGGSSPPLPTTLWVVEAAWNRARRGRKSSRLWRASGNSSAVERQPSKLGVAGSNPVSRSTWASEFWMVELEVAAFGVEAVGAPARNMIQAHVAQLAEHALGKGEVSGSSPDMGSITLAHRQAV